MITDEDYEKYIGIHMPNIRKLTLERTVKTVNEIGQVSMTQESNEVIGLRLHIASDSDSKRCECKISVLYTECDNNLEFGSFTQEYIFVLPNDKFSKWNQSIDNNNIGDQRYGVVLIENYETETREARSGLIMHHETVYRSTKLILNK